MRLPQLTLLASALAASLAFYPAPTSRTQEDTSEEIVANLAAGRVLIAVFKDAIAIGTIENKVESSAELPLIVPISSERVGILLGAVDWFSPSTRTSIADLPRELPHLRYHRPGTVEGPHLIQPPANDAVAADIEQTAIGVMSRLTEVSSNIHGHVDVKPDEPLTELVLADYVEAYGPEAWLMTYKIDQQPERGDFWVTQVKRPRYTQLWPPEKTAPHVLLEVDYPSTPGKTPEQAAQNSAVRNLLSSHAKELDSVRSSSAMSAACDSLLSNTLNQQASDLALPCLRASMDALASASSAKEELALLTPDGNIRWIIAPPPDTRPKLKPANPGQQDENAPSLERPSLERPSNPPPSDRPPSLNKPPSSPN